MSNTHVDYEKAAAFIQERITVKPAIGMVLGSGLGQLADELDESVVIPYADIPGWPASTVVGHGGNLVVGLLEGKPVVVQQGRAHYYEGYSVQQVTFPIRVMRFLGIGTVILTNAAGGMNTTFTAGDIMVINDHISFIGLAGHSPLIGPNDDSLGPRFVSLAQTYDRELRQLAHRVAEEHGEQLREGVYVGISGPAFESPAEIRMLRMMGGDAVGMSTVHEATVARHMSLRILAFSSITNITIDQIDTNRETDHVEVLEVGATIVPRLAKIVRGVVANL